MGALEGIAGHAPASVLEKKQVILTLGLWVIWADSILCLVTHFPRQVLIFGFAGEERRAKWCPEPSKTPPCPDAYVFSGYLFGVV